MGLYNLVGTVEHITQEDIRRGACPICKKAKIKPLILDGSQDSFDYHCDFCQKTISMSGSVLGSDDYWKAYAKNNQAQTELKTEVKNYPDDRYPLYSDTMSFFLGESYSQDLAKNYDDWKNGKVPGYPNKYKSISEQELVKINKEQKLILEKSVESTLKRYTDAYHETKSESINPTKYLEFEIDTVEKIFSTAIQPNIRQVNLGNWTMDVDRLSKIQGYYRHAVGGRIPYNIVVSPNQKLRIGTQKEEMECLIDALMYSKYLEFLNSEKALSENGDDASAGFIDYYSKHELKDLKTKIDEVLQNLEKLGLGQEIIYDEIESLKTSSKKNSKKDFKDLVLGKLCDLGLNHALDSELSKNIYSTIFGDDFPKLLG
jgi:hypothetical protein